MNENPMTDSGVSADDRNLAIFAHLLGIVTWFVGALVIWLIHKDKPEKAFVTDQAKEALNFNITVGIAGVAMFIMGIIFGFIPVIGILVGILLWVLWFAMWIGVLVLSIIAALKANEGIAYRYPFTLRLVN